MLETQFIQLTRLCISFMKEFTLRLFSSDITNEIANLHLKPMKGRTFLQVRGGGKVVFLVFNMKV